MSGLGHEAVWTLTGQPRALNGETGYGGICRAGCTAWGPGALLVEVIERQGRAGSLQAPVAG